MLSLILGNIPTRAALPLPIAIAPAVTGAYLHLHPPAALKPWWKSCLAGGRVPGNCLYCGISMIATTNSHTQKFYSCWSGRRRKSSPSKENGLWLLGVCLYAGLAFVWLDLRCSLLCLLARPAGYHEYQKSGTAENIHPQGRRKIIWVQWSIVRVCCRGLL